MAQVLVYIPYQGFLTNRVRSTRSSFLEPLQKLLSNEFMQGLP
jgi:hypothetical protein